MNALNRLMQDLRWLVTEGFVAEYSDGRLVAHPVMTPQAQAQEEKGAHAPEAPAEPAPESAPAPEAPPATEAVPEASAEASAPAAPEPAAVPTEEPPPPAPAS
jgi:hypothetical protein